MKALAYLPTLWGLLAAGVVIDEGTLIPAGLVIGGMTLSFIAAWRARGKVAELLTTLKKLGQRLDELEAWRQEQEEEDG